MNTVHVNAVQQSVPSEMLNPNHSLFILIDDGSEGQFGKEIEFRSELEAEIRKGRNIEYYQELMRRKRRGRIYSKTHQNHLLGTYLRNFHANNENNDDENTEQVPMVLICVQGGFYSLKTVVKSIEKNIPVLFLAGIKGCADLIANSMNSNYHMYFLI